MRSYTVTITPDDGVGAQTVVKLQVDGATPRITKLELTAATGQTLATSQLPAINLEMLLASVQPATTPRATAAPAVAPATVETPAADIPAATPRKRPASTGRATKAAAPARAAKPAPKATKKAATPAKKTKAQPTASGRAYRTMPDDFAAVYQQASSVGAVADFYGVPRHTAQNWVATARRHDLIPASQRRKDAGDAGPAAASNGQGLFLAPAAHQG